jgi:hypothetical protein
VPSLPESVRADSALTGAAAARRGGSAVPAPEAPAPGGRAAGGRYWARLTPLLVLLSAAVHIPAFCRAVWNPDEGFVAVQARLLAHGGTLYHTVVDRKPPLLPWLYQGCFALFGEDSLWPLRAAAVVAHVLTAVLLASVARRRWGDRYGAAGGVAYVLLSIGLAPEDTQAANFEVFTLPWTAAAFWCADRSRWGAAGLAVAGAALTKQSGAAVLVPVAWMLWRASRRDRGGSAFPAPARHYGGDAPDLPAAASPSSPAQVPPRLFPDPRAAASPPASDRGFAPGPGRGFAGGLRCLRGGLAPGFAWTRLAAGVLAPVTVVALGLGVKGFVFWTVTGSSAYLSPHGAWLTALGRALGNAGILAAAGAGLLAPAVWLAVRGRRFVAADVIVWLAASAVAVTVAFQFYGHYYLQLLPPLVLVAVAALRRLPHWWKPAAAWTALASGVFLVWGLAAPRTELDHAVAVAVAVRRHTEPDDTVLVWGMHPEQYWLARRAPASRYLTAGFLTNFSGGHGAARVGERYAVPGVWRTFGREVAARPPALVVDDSRGAPYAPRHTPILRGLLAERYQRVATVGGAVLYALKNARGEPRVAPPRWLHAP